LLKKGYSYKNIGDALERSKSSIGYEVKENSVKGKYDPKKAQHKAYVKRHKASFRGKQIVKNSKLRTFIEFELLKDQSPSAISGRIKYKEKHLSNISKNTIYRFLDSPYGQLISNKRKKVKKRSKKNQKVTKLKDRTFIDKRPKIIEKRGRVGDVEADFIVSGRSGKGILLVIVCRKIRIVFIEILYEVSVDEVHKAFLKIQKRFPEMKSITTDNDILLKMHKVLEKLLGLKIYFCFPYHSWEKGTVENANKYIRKYIPKGSDISQYTRCEIEAVEKKLNQRFMECLKFATPQEELNKHRKRIKKNKKTTSIVVKK